MKIALFEPRGSILATFRHFMDPGGHFFAIFALFSRKMTPGVHKMPYILAKNPNIQNPIPLIVVYPSGNICTKNQPFWSIWVDFYRLSVENRVSKIATRKTRKMAFFARKSAIFQNFSNIFWNLLETIEIHIWSKF